MTEFQPQGESWAVIGTQWSWTIGRSRKFTRIKVGSYLKTRPLSSLKSSPHQSSCGWLFCFNFFEYSFSPSECIPNEDAVQDWSNSNWPGMGPLKKSSVLHGEMSAGSSLLCSVSGFMKCFHIYSLIWSLLSPGNISHFMDEETQKKLTCSWPVNQFFLFFFLFDFLVS